MHDLLARMFLPAFRNPLLEVGHDASVFPAPPGRLAFTTDSYVVRPLFFPGGDIGSMSIHGTVNDLAMSGARPLYLSAGFILEEGLPMETLWRVVASMRDAAARCGVQIITGDTKVVDKGKGDGLFVNTAGIGVVAHELTIAPACVRPGALGLSVFTVIAFLVPLAAALLCGRVFCGAVCPMGALQELLGWRARRVPRPLDRVLRLGGWLMLCGALAAATWALALPICKFDPFVTLFRHTGPREMWLFTTAFLLVCVLVARPYCRWVCPYAKLLGVFAKISFLGRRIDAAVCGRCGGCESKCPVDAIREGHIDLFACVACGRCTENCARSAVR